VGTERQSSARFPTRVLTGILVLAAVASLAASGLDHRYQSVRVVGVGMEPTLPNGSRVRVELHAYDTSKPSRGDLIIYEDTGPNDTSLKRVVGLPGEHVSIDNGVVKIDGQPLSEPYIAATTRCDADDECDVVLGEDELYVLGDNRPTATDSRSFGPIELSRVRGKITSVFWPPALPWDRKPLT
jgi:signal peptidase I